ncbi:MAG TPA: hypothetical protein VGM12_30930 [Trebonia sp.]|jgi:transcriptional regulator with XRE-family HTH domain
MAVLATVKDNGMSVKEMTQLSGANRSTIYRWMSGGEGQPDYDLVNRLARAIWRRHPELARELVEASGYAWAEPADEPEPEPLIPPEVLAALESAYADDPELLRRAVEAQEAIATERRAEGLSRRQRPAG